MTVPIIREYSNSKDKNESKYNEYNDKPIDNDESKPDNNMKNELSNFLSKLR